MAKMLKFETNFAENYTDRIKCVKNAVDLPEKRWYFRLRKRQNTKTKNKNKRQAVLRQTAADNQEGKSNEKGIEMGFKFCNDSGNRRNVPASKHDSGSIREQSI